MTDPQQSVVTTGMPAERNADVAKRLQRGDRRAWEEMYEFYSHDLWRYVSRLAGNERDVVAEIVQEVFLSAAKNAKSYDLKRGSLWAWLTGIAHRQTANLYRAKARDSKVYSQTVQQRLLAQQGTGSNNNSPSMVMEQDELRVTVRTTLARLTTEYAMLLSAKYLDRLSIEEMQIQFGGTSDSIRSKLKRARAEFRDQFARNHSGGLET